ncbi:MAG: precorrin-3B C(17)-methyltransferase [Microcoleus sp. PH2017_01_SCD_O_A]|uniref:precorrin-3B C(17)-methyltransferase n=1 Tax=unclassified Microcoleus TaxID=2642155 RepID=UPI001D73549F|nr:MULTISPECIES: precorrin-3B C(17)-methyltransferase [unclassified Microcoleus]MCC3417753.1 precorrin-3B C(17)-methyltransferase [Microcoleus sp. PH2017_07_MST_O_A]MCC3445051.1 precorrin-3B C(17)-methyltransferase [Microcoleus sp. PH2017_03_ELD_O_A]MCC3504485.1 precorrin-3B C(17)-methyltransferase [Microcoleus sp. PH2017_19_SFW_U_A]TAE65233.1 MAG: precorrin-3B C(17)-methyltransferase [Oscillatoriales cyanobacterium]MCC3426922.1 precorrin-3B C(17)-methyltransferase [Microcoleus sp. PH2017_01_S
MNRLPPAIIILGQNSLAIAKTISKVFPGSQIYGLVDRTSDTDINFSNFGETLRELFATETPIIAICAAGIIIRTLAPLLSDKRAEPPVLAVAEDGSAVVPLLGGLHGVNDLAREIAAALGVQPAITTTGDIRFRTALLSPPQGYYLANPEDAKTFISNLLAGAKVQLEGAANWLSESNLPLAQPAPTGATPTERIAPEAKLTIRVTEKAIVPTPDCLVYHPQIAAFALTNLSYVEPEIAISYVQQILENADLAAASVAGFFALKHDMGNPTLEAISQFFKVPVRFLNLPELVEFDTVKLIQYNSSFDVTAAQISLTAAGANSQLIAYDRTNAFSCAIALATEPIDPSAIGVSRGKLAIVGTGPGGAPWMSPEVKEILREATDWVGYKFYLDLAGTLREGQNRHDSDNREEIDRARFALDLAASGKSVAVVSSGDPGIFAMAAAVFEAIDFDAKPEWEGIDIRVAPGISAMQAAAAAIGAPLGHDFCVISLSDILKPWEVIEQRISAAAAADLVMAFYNPISKQRVWQLKRAIEILLETRDAKTPVVLGRNLGRSGQSVRVCTLGEFQPEDADMRTLVIVGSSQTRIIPRKFGDIWVYTPRRYEK